MNTRLAYRHRPWRTLRAPAGGPSSCLVNDVHSQLNAAGMVRPRSVDELCDAVAATAARSLSIWGRRIMTIFVRTALALAVCFSLPGQAAAQDQGSTQGVQELVLTDGSRLYGTVLSRTGTEVVLKTAAGPVISAPRDRIVSLREVHGRIVRGEFRREDPNGTRLFFGPTGRSLERGQVYLGVFEFMMPFVQVGITNRISVGGGTPLIFGFGEESSRPFWVTPKVQLISSNGFTGAAGAFHGFSPEGETFGIAYGVVTKELRAGSVTGGAGMGYSSEDDRGAVAMIGADAPLRRNMKFITENYIWRSAVIASGGVRFFGDSLSADVGLGVVFTDGEAFAGPVVNFMYLF